MSTVKFYVNQSIEAIEVPEAEALTRIKEEAQKNDAWVYVDGNFMDVGNLTQSIITGAKYIDLNTQVVGG